MYDDDEEKNNVTMLSVDEGLKESMEYKQLLKKKGSNFFFFFFFFFFFLCNIKAKRSKKHMKISPS
jgi:hypothetical protein